MFSMSKANSANDKGNYPHSSTEENDMAFHKIVPVKKAHTKPAPKPAPKKAAPKKVTRRPVGNK
jgi:hypothetical protein